MRWSRSRCVAASHTERWPTPQAAQANRRWNWPAAPTGRINDDPKVDGVDGVRSRFPRANVVAVMTTRALGATQMGITTLGLDLRRRFHIASGGFRTFGHAGCQCGLSEFKIVFAYNTSGVR